MEEKTYPERTRGQIEIDINTCIFCGICSKKCPTGAITVERSEKKWEIERFACIQCGACTESCPKKCLFMAQHYPSPDSEKKFDTFIKQEEVKTEENK